MSQSAKGVRKIVGLSSVQKKAAGVKLICRLTLLERSRAVLELPPLLDDPRHHGLHLGELLGRTVELLKLLPRLQQDDTLQGQARPHIERDGGGQLPERRDRQQRDLDVPPP